MQIDTDKVNNRYRSVNDFLNFAAPLANSRMSRRELLEAAKESRKAAETSSNGVAHLIRAIEFEAVAFGLVPPSQL